MNYLDYTDDECMNAFSEGQKTRMLAALNIDRASILTSNGCVPVGIEENNLRSFFKVYPNPAVDKLFVNSLQGQYIKTEISVTGMLGETVIPYQTLSVDGVDISMLRSGVYFLKLSTNKGNAVFKIIKQ